MKRILYVDLSPNPGGSVISLYQLVSSLDRSQFQPLVVLARVNPFRRFEQSAAAPVMPVRVPRWERRDAGLVERIRAGRLGEEMRSGQQRARLWHAAGDARRLVRDTLPVVPPLLRIIRHFRPDLIHLNDAIPLVRPGLIASRLFRTPALCHCRTFLTPTPGDNRWLAPAIDGLIFISQAVGQAQLAAMPRPPRHRVIPNAINVADYEQAASRANLRAALGLPADAPLIGIIGRISPWKGQHIFVEALALLKRRFPGVHGLIVGFAEEADGPGYAQQVRQQADNLGIAGQIRWTGFRDDVPQILAALDVLVHCSVKPEPFGRVIIEGMAAGKAVAGSRSGGALEIISDGVDGRLVEPGDPAALADLLAELLADPAQRARLGAAARQTAIHRYDIAAHVAAVQDFYHELLSS